EFWNMTDHVAPSVRSRMMSAVRSRDTQPEKRVRNALHQAGFRFRLHRGDLPGRPDIVLPKFRTVVLVHGCLWHGHECPRGRRPTSNVAFWNKKLDSNLERDRRNKAALAAAGWRVFVVWECSIETEIRRLIRYLDHAIKRGATW